MTRVSHRRRVGARFVRFDPIWSRVGAACLAAACLAGTLCLAATLCLANGCREVRKPAVFRFSAIPNENQKQLRVTYEPVARYLAERTGVAVEYVPAAKYDATVTMFVNNDIQMAWYGGLTGVQARAEVPGAHAVVKGELDGRYRAYVIVAKNSPVRRSETFPTELAGRRFTFGAKTSTSGRLMPEYFIRQATGKAPAELFREVGYSGDHAMTIRMVKDGVWDAGVVDFAVYDGQVKEGKLDPNDCPVVWTTPPFADYQFTVRPGLDAVFGAGFTDRLTKSLLAMDPDMAGRFRRRKMVPAGDADFAGIAAVARDLGLVRPVK